MADLADGESVEVPGSGSSIYTLKNTGGVYSCSCPAWRNQSIAIESRSCKHLRRFRGDEAEEQRVGSAQPSPRTAKTKINEDGIEVAKEPPVLLAESWDGVVDVEGWWISEKLDGVRAYWDGTQFLSRQGNLYVAPDWFTAGLPKEPLDGELWLDRKMFQRTVSIVRRQDQSEHWRQIRYVVFDAPGLTEPFEQRTDYLSDMIKGIKSPFVSAHQQQRCNGISHLKDELARVESLGGEGLMLRQPASKYVSGRSSTLLKVKTFHDSEAEVIAHQPGAGRHKGRMGALLVRLSDGTEFSVGTGFSDAQRNAPPPVGSSITFRYQELTDGGVPRFPSYVGVRNDEGVAALSGSVERKNKPSANASKPKAKETLATAKPESKVAKSSNAAKSKSKGSNSNSTRSFQFQDDKSDKFWEITVDDLEVTVRYGRTGTAGQTNTKEFSDAASAQKHADKLISEKTAKGYLET